MNEYKFDPLKHNYEPISKFPELSYIVPLIDDRYFVKILEYADYGGLVYWYSFINLGIGLEPDDRIEIKAGVHDTRIEYNYDKQARYTFKTKFLGLITSDNFAKELLLHLFGTTRNSSVDDESIERYNNTNEKMRIDFPNYKKY